MSRLVALGLALLAACGPADEPAADGPAFAGANLLLISLDTCRADALSLHGGPAGASPALDAFAAECVVFDHARAAAPHTAPSHMSLFTSTWPSVHGVQNVQHGRHPVTGKRKPLIEGAPLELPTLAELLAASGYRTIGLTDGGNLNPPHGFDRGFEHYTFELSGAADQVRIGSRWVSELHARAQPWFLFLHTYEIHAPYVSPQEYVQRWAPADYAGPLREAVEGLQGKSFREKFGAMRTVFWKEQATFGAAEADYLRGLYRAGVEYTDDVFAPLFDQLRASGALDDTIVVVLSDHGEEFAEHGRWQHEQLFEESLRVPLMVRLPGGVGAGTRIATPVSLIDVLPTLVELLGVERNARVPMQGQSLARTLLEGVEPPARPIVSELRSDRRFPDGAAGPLHDWLLAVHHQGAKLIYDEYSSDAEQGVQRYRLFELADDPDERRDLVRGGAGLVDDAGPAAEAARRGLLAARERVLGELALFADLASGASGELDCEQLRQLVELGYVDGSALEGCD